MQNYDSLYEYQKEGIETLTNFIRNSKSRAAFLADPPGAGKTPQAIGVCEELVCRNVLVICPASLRENWVREFHRWSIYTRVQCVENSKTIIDPGSEVIVCSYTLAIHEDILKQIESMTFDMLILDEAHYCKSPRSQTSRVILVPIWARCRHRLLLSGTPVPNGRAAEAWTTFGRCAPQLFGSWDAFRAKYCIQEMTKWGPAYPQSKNLNELREAACASFMLRRPKEVITAQLPGLVRQNIYMRLPEMDVLNAQGGIDVELIVQAIELGLPLDSDNLATARRKLALLKAPKILEHCEQLLEEVHQIVVFVHHRELYSFLADAFYKQNITCVGINGLTPANERQTAVDEFQKKNARVMLASLKAANTGLTMTSASTLVMAEYDWVPSTNEQAEGRIYRVTQKEICRVQYLVAADSLDEKVLKVIQRKQKEINKAIGA